MMNEVILPCWEKFAKDIHSAETIDLVLEAHDKFLDTCLNQCMLTDSNLFNIIYKLTSTCVIYSNYVTRFNETILIDSKAQVDRALRELQDDEAHSHLNPQQLKQIAYQQASESQLTKLKTDENYKKTIHKCEDNFNHHLNLLLEALAAVAQYDTHISDLSIRIDFNGYYSRCFQHLNAT